MGLDDASLPGSHRFDREITHFAGCVLGEEIPEVPAEEGVADLRLLGTAFEAIRSGKRVAV